MGETSKLLEVPERALRGGEHRRNLPEVRYALAYGSEVCYTSVRGALKTPCKRPPHPSDSRFFCALRFPCRVRGGIQDSLGEHATPSYSGS
jgi:hypothetical protein